MVVLVGKARLWQHRRSGSGSSGGASMKTTLMGRRRLGVGNRNGSSRTDAGSKVGHGHGMHKLGRGDLWRRRTWMVGIVSTKHCYEHCVADFNQTYGFSDIKSKEQLCRSINTLLRRMKHDERLELCLCNSEWKFLVVKVEVICLQQQGEVGKSSNINEVCENAYNISVLSSEINTIEEDIKEILSNLKAGKKTHFQDNCDFHHFVLVQEICSLYG